MRATQQQKVVNVGMTSTMKFLNTIYILSKSGDTYGTYVSVHIAWYIIYQVLLWDVW